MDWNKIIHSISMFLAFEHAVFSLTLQTEDVITILKENNRIILNCTYQEDSKVDILNRDIRWQKLIGEEFKNIAVFSPPGGQDPFIPKDMEPLYINRSELIAPNTSLSAVMIIKNPVCSDEGIYQCLIQYFSDVEEKIQTSRSLVEFEYKAREPDEFLVFPNELEENQSISLTCRADVGSPPGSITIWKNSKLIYTSNSTNYKTDNCTEIINVTTTYTVTRDDNGAMFRCSSQNSLTLRPGPNKESSRISVTYGPKNTRIVASFSSSRVFIGDHVKMECISDGNPDPNYTWKYNLTDLMSNGKYTFSADKSELSFTITNITDSGNYQCMASINLKGQLFNSYSSLTLTVQEKNIGAYPLELENTCYENSCSSVQNCVVKNGHAFCSVNIWIVIAIVFIIITLILCATTLSFILLSRTQRLKTVNSSEEMDMGGYLSPVGEANGSSYEALGQGNVHVYSTMQTMDHGSSYEALVQGNVHAYSTMQNLDHGSSYEALGQGNVHAYSTMQTLDHGSSYEALR